MKSQEIEKQCSYCGQFICVCDEEFLQDKSWQEDYYPYNEESDYEEYSKNLEIEENYDSEDES